MTDDHDDDNMCCVCITNRVIYSRCGCKNIKICDTCLKKSLYLTGRDKCNVCLQTYTGILFERKTYFHGTLNLLILIFVFLSGIVFGGTGYYVTNYDENSQKSQYALLMGYTMIFVSVIEFGCIIYTIRYFYIHNLSFFTEHFKNLNIIID